MIRYLISKLGRFLMVTLILQGITGCSINFDEDAVSDSGATPPDVWEEDPSENQLLVSGSGEIIILEYNTLTFSARLNWEDGNYYFSPDPDGEMSGHRIVCHTSISEYDLEGDCFREGRVCHFRYYDSWATSENKDIYSLSTSTCKTAASVGPFLVPLESPLCGEDPFPTCPSDDLFPDGEEEEDGPVAVDDEAVDQLIETLCDAAVRCDSGLNSLQCVMEMNSVAGRQIWDDLGLEEAESQRTTAEIRSLISAGSVGINEEALGDCLHELGETCDNTGERVAIGNYANVENLISEEGSCPSVFVSALLR